ncbi:MAG TPA: PadR family transcriptional regulator [Candidatus Baltobacteraceae bacterium]|jgi:DNA-binding PadR family transcriptional regulator|nr:PadR family transcriptional regulator [Candidatus Baltobacteraceae bacterium]
MFHFKYGPGFGHGFGPGSRHGRGMRGGGRGRGEMKYEILDILQHGPRHGYDIMLEIERTRGLRPSPGSIYPALQMLEDGDFIRGTERDGKRVYEIADKGRQLLSEREPAGEDFFTVEGLHAVVVEAMRQVHGIQDAAKQIAKTRNLETFKRAIAVLDKARRELFDILADHV